MKFCLFSVFASLLLATTALAQHAYIGYPTDGSTVQSGTNITVMVAKPDTLVGSTDISIVLGLEQCPGDASTCFPQAYDVGQILYYGPYNPEFVLNPGFNLPPYQNFTVYVPADQPTGTNLLSLTHLALVGVSIS
jgi:hypothetical protein